MTSQVWCRVLLCGPSAPLAGALQHLHWIIKACLPVSLPSFSPNKLLSGGAGATPSSVPNTLPARHFLLLFNCLFTACSSVLHLPFHGCKWNVHHHSLFISLYFSQREARARTHTHTHTHTRLGFRTGKIWVHNSSSFTCNLRLTCTLSHFSGVRLCDPVDRSPPGSSVHGIL